MVAASETPDGEVIITVKPTVKYVLHHDGGPNDGMTTESYLPMEEGAPEPGEAMTLAGPDGDVVQYDVASVTANEIRLRYNAAASTMATSESRASLYCEAGPFHGKTLERSGWAVDQVKPGLMIKLDLERGGESAAWYRVERRDEAQIYLTYFGPFPPHAVGDQPK